MVCPRCAKENDEHNRFCGRCGLDFSEYEHNASAASEETLFCYRHKKAPTNLRCGRCDQPICTKCTVMGPAGPRCPDCAKQNIPIRGRAIAHEVKRSLFGLGRLGPWGIYLLIILAGIIFSGVRSCQASQRESIQEPVDVRMKE